MISVLLIAAMLALPLAGGVFAVDAGADAASVMDVTDAAGVTGVTDAARQVEALTDVSKVEALTLVASTIAGGYAGTTDGWAVMSMARYGKADAADTAGYLAGAAADVESPDSATTVAKAAIIHTTLGLDAAKIPVLGAEIDLVGKLLNYSTAEMQVNGLAFALLAVDADDSSRGEGAASARWTAARADWIAAILAEQVADGGWNWYTGAADSDLDLTAMVLTALAPYYNDAAWPAVTASVEKALLYLSQSQNAHGCYASAWDPAEAAGNSSTTATVLIALTSLGIDADGDARFVKGGKSLIDGLLLFESPEHTIGFNDGTDASGFSIEQAFRAIVPYLLFVEGGKAGPVSAYYKVFPGGTAGAGEPKPTLTPAPTPTPTPTPTSTPPGSGTGNNGTGDGGTVTKQATLTVEAPGRTILAKKTYTITAGQTVQTLLSAAFDAAGISYRFKSGYLSSAAGLTEFDDGPLSGWVFTVNGAYSNQGIGQYSLSGGEDVIVRYSHDASAEPGINWGGSGTGSGSGGTGSGGGGTGSLTGSPTPTPKDTATPKATPTPKATASPQRRSAVSPKPTSAQAGSGRKTRSAAATATATNPPATGTIAGLSDAAQISDWAAPFVEQALAAGLTHGGADGALRPGEDVTRAEFAEMLMSLPDLGGASQSYTDTFLDVPETAWHWPYVLAASELGIVLGDGEGHFNPDAAISREDMAVMVDRVYRALDGAEDGNQNYVANGAAVVFSDAAEIADYATASVGRVAGIGAMVGDDGRFLPKAQMTREMAITVIVRLNGSPRLFEQTGTEAELALVEREIYGLVETIHANTPDAELTEWQAIGLALNEGVLPRAYLDALKTRYANEPGDFRLPTDLARVELALRTGGTDTAEVLGVDLAARLLNTENLDAQGANGPIFALLISMALPEQPEGARWTPSALADKILEYQREDGGFSLAEGLKSDVDVTAMAVFALVSDLYESGETSNADTRHEESLRGAIRPAAEFILSQKEPDGGFRSTLGGAASLESLSWSICAFSVLGFDTGGLAAYGEHSKPLIAELLEYKNADGGFAHIKGETSDPIATEQALFALSIHHGMLLQNNG
jgi:hypothetical protein